MAVNAVFLIKGSRPVVAGLRQLEGVKFVYPVRLHNAMAMVGGERVHDIGQLVTKIKGLSGVSLVAAWYILSVRHERG